MYLVSLENSAQCRATQLVLQVLSILFTFKTISNLQLKLRTLTIKITYTYN